MNKKPIKKRIVWRNFAKLMGVALVLVSLAMFYIYQSSMSVAKEQFLSINEQKLEMFSSGLQSAVSQAERIAAALCVDSDSFLFFEGEHPEESDEGIWKRIKAKLKTYSFGINYIDSITLYSPSHERIISDTGTSAVSIQAALEGKEYDVGWIAYLQELGENEMLIQPRSMRNGYPYVLTIMKHYERVNCEGVVIINLDLMYLFSEIWMEQEDTQAYVLNQEGQVLMSSNKSALLESREAYPDLVDFSFEDTDKSVMVSDVSVPYTYAQVLMDDFGFYAVTHTNMEGYKDQIAQKQLQMFAVYIACIVFITFMVLLYCTVSYRPFGRILELLDDHNSWKQNDGTSTQIPEIVEKIVYHLQANEELKEALDDRLKLLKATQIQALQSQLSPHFIYNSLDAIGSMVERLEGDNGKIGKMVDSLVDVFRYSVSGQELVSVETELEYLRKYSYILECRYGNSFEIDFDFEEDLSTVRIPRLILQPLIENAVFHGLMARMVDIGGILTVRGRTVQHRFDGCADEEASIRIDVADNGYGMSPDRLEEIKALMCDFKHTATHNIGVQNTVKRLYLLYSERMYVNIQSERGRGTTITLIFPREQ